MLFRALTAFYKRLKTDWRLLTLASYLITSGLTLLVFYGGHPSIEQDKMDSLMNTLAGILTTIVVTTFSFVFVALQLASVQFSPRILRSFFIHDQFSRFFLWINLACVGYLIGLQYANLAQVSGIYAHFGFVGSLYLIVLVFPLFIHHVIDNINASSITRNIARRTVAEIEELYDIPQQEIQWGNLVLVKALRSGYLDSIRYRALEALFPGDPEVKMLVRPRIGVFVLKGSVIAEIDCPATKRTSYQNKVRAIEACFIISRFRSYKQDVPFGIRQLVDMAVKAISPAVNDPTTALNCLDYLGTVIQKAAQSDTMSREAQRLSHRNIHIREFSFDQLIDLTFDQIYNWGQTDYIIVRHIIRTITHVIPFTAAPDKLWVLIRQVDDMELQYLHSAKAESALTGPFLRREHRNSLRDYLDHFYKAVVLQIEKIQAQDDNLPAKMEQYRQYRVDLRHSRE